MLKNLVPNATPHYWQCFRKNDEGGLFPLKGKNRRIITSDRPPPSIWETILYAMLKNLVILLRSAELTHASDKFDFTTKGFGADKEIRSQKLRQLRGGGQSAPSSLNVIGWRHTVEYGALKLASTLSVVLGNPWFSLGNNYLVFLKREWKTVLWKLLTMFSKKWRRWFISFKRKESTYTSDGGWAPKARSRSQTIDGNPS